MDTCEECGMPVNSGEYHPYAACLMFKACCDSDVVHMNTDAILNRCVESKHEPVVKILHKPTVTTIKNAIACGMANTNEPPAGHGLTDFWAIGNNLACCLDLFEKIKNWDENSAVYLPKPGPERLFHLRDDIRCEIQEILKLHGK